MNNNRKREQPLHTYLNNNRRKQNMAQREQLTLCWTQVNKHKWKHNIKKLGLFKMNVYTSTKNNYETTVSDKYYEFDGEIQHRVVSELQRRYMARR